MFELKMAKHISQNAPKYSRIVEPFGSYGTIAMESMIKKPKEHILNVEDLTIFTLMTFLKNITATDKRALKEKDWISSEETFNSVQTISATEGYDFYYKYIYNKNFGSMAMGKGGAEGTIMYDWLTKDENIKNKLFEIPIMTMALKKSTITNEVFSSTLNSSMSSDTFLILTPKKPEEISACEQKIKSISNPFFYAKKSKSNDELLSVVNQENSLKISAVSAGAVMPGTAQVITNYENDLQDLKELTTNMQM